jgi:mRNA interferase RelE/StbE
MRFSKSLLIQRRHYRYRIGDYRVIYSVDDELFQVFVVAIAHRSEAYES